MVQKTFQGRILWRLVTPLILALCLVAASSKSVVALSMDDYFTYSYDLEFSKVEIRGSEVFDGTVEAEATCTNDLPTSASEASITGCIVAEHQTSGAKVTLNPSYTVTINPFPNQKGQTTQVSLVVPLQFPHGSQSGTYSVIAELTEAKVKAIIWFPVTAFLPSSLTVGSITYASQVEAVEAVVVVECQRRRHRGCHQALTMYQVSSLPMAHLLRQSSPNLKMKFAPSPLTKIL